MLTNRFTSPLKIALAWSLAYVALGSLWISVSDALLSRLELSITQTANIQTYKGWSYVAVTGVLIFGILFSALRRQVRLYDQLEERERGLSEFISSLPGMTYQCKNDGQWTMTFVSDFSLELTGFRPDELIGNSRISWDDLIHPDDRTRVRQTVDDALRTGSRFGITYRIRTSDLTEKWVKETGRSIRRGSAEDQLLEGFIIDITHERQLERRLVTAQRLEALGSLSAGVAHDFNNLLTGIAGYAHLLQHELEDKPEAARDLDAVVSLTEKASELTRQLLTFSRGQEIEVVTLDLNSQVENILKILSRTLPARIEVIRRLDPGLKKLKADPTQIEQLLMNLVLNAADAMPDGGQLTIATSNLEVEPTSPQAVDLGPGWYVKLVVADTGTGIEESILQNIFDPFFSTKGEKGTGLGLSTVYGITQKHRGLIEVESREGQGACFIVYLPAASDEISESRR